jgi:hypothetical protein
MLRGFLPTKGTGQVDLDLFIFYDARCSDDGFFWGQNGVDLFFGEGKMGLLKKSVMHMNNIYKILFYVYYANN